jgi:hypothetical protein
MDRADPFDQFDGCGNGRAAIDAKGLADKIYNLWDRSPVTVKSTYLASNGRVDRPTATKLPSY